MEQPKKRIRFRITISMNKEEYEKCRDDFKKTIYRSYSEYAKRLIFRKPVTVTYRNRSLDDFTEACIQFKKDLDRILSTPFITESDKGRIYEEVSTIKEFIIKTYDHVQQNKHA